MSENLKLSEQELKELKLNSAKIREHVIKMITTAKSGHPGGSLSAVDIILTLYSKCMKHYKEWKNHPDWENRDRFILCKGHASAALYAVLAENGYFSTDELLSFRSYKSRLQGHPSFGFLPGIEVSTGSLGQGLSICCGIALGLKLDNKDSKVFALLGDGELQEGQVWEAAMNASHHKLGNIIAFVDRNSLQIDGCTENIKALDPLDKKWVAFGWNTFEIDGHDHSQIYQAVQDAIKLGGENSKPSVIISNTIKGKGVSFMENNCDWHGKAPSVQQCELALDELKGKM